MKLEKEKRPRVFEEGGSSDKSQACSLPQSTTRKVSGVCQVSLCIVLVHIFVPRCSTHSHLQSKLVSAADLHLHLFPSVFWRKVERGGEWRGKEEESSAVLTVWSLRGILLPRRAPALPPLTSGRCSRARESRSRGGDLCRSRGGGWLSQSQGPPPSPLLFTTSREETERNVRKNKKVGRYYGDCVAGLLWAELGDKLGLQLPGGAPLVRPPVAPLSRPSEFSSISWMRGGMEPGISIFRVMTRSAPVGGGGWRETGKCKLPKISQNKHHSFICSFLLHFNMIRNEEAHLKQQTDA